MKLNFDFYSEKKEEKLTAEEEMQVQKYFSDFNNNFITQTKDDLPLKDFKLVTEINTNILNWYEFEEQAEILDLNPNFGEAIREVLKRVKKITAISNQRIKANSMQKNYLRSTNLEVLVGYFEDVELDKKFDYVTIIGVKDAQEFEKKINYAKSHLKPNGKILVAFDNKFGMKYWTGIKQDIPNQYDTLTGKIDKLTIDEAETILKQNSLFHKRYYPLPDYRLTNVIFSDDYLPDAESIMSRDLICFEDDEYCEFSPRLAYIELLKENENYFKLFADSYFLEIGFEEIQNEIRYANFEMYRKPQYNIKTIMKKDFVYKTANHEIAQSHIETIRKNIEILKEHHIKTLDSYNNQQIISKYAKDGIPLDQYLVNIFQEQGKEATIDFMQKFKNEIIGQFSIIAKPATTIFDKYKITPKQNINHFHFIKDGLIDLRGQNCFVIDGEFYLYDQEWYEENVPIEYLMYRFIFYNNTLDKLIPKVELYERFGLTEYLEIFKELDIAVFGAIRDDYVMIHHATSIDRIGRKTKELFDLQKKMETQIQHNENLQTIINDLNHNIEESNKTIHLSNNHIKELETIIETNQTEIQNCKLEMQNYENGIQDLRQQIEAKQQEVNYYVNQLQVISNSVSWKITKPLRYLSWVFNFKNNLKLIDRLMPPGSGMRRRYEEKRHQYFLRLLVKRFSQYTDRKTAKIWANLFEKMNQFRMRKPSEKSYDQWMKNNEPTTEELEKQRNHAFAIQPKISIVVPLYDTPIEFFRELLFFMNQQTYQNWELCLADGSEKPLEEIQKMCDKDSRIKYQFLGENKGISENTNRAIEMATGEFIGLLDHDDLLAMNALYEVVKVINENETVDFIYSDEDKIQTLDKPRYMPLFKPDFAIDTLRANNYICHFSVIRKTLLDKVGYFNHEFDGAQDYDLILRVTEQAQKIIHIPKILYHWRVHQKSTAMSGEAKPYAFIAGRKVLEAHLKRVNLARCCKRWCYFRNLCYRI